MHRAAWASLVGCFLLLLCICAVSQPVFAEDPSDLPRVVTHDNLQSAGQLKDGVLTIRLEIVEAGWHPGEDSGPYLPLLAFAEEGKPPMIPAPLIRVPEGTEIHAFVHNKYGFPARVHGLHARPGDAKDALVLKAGETQDFRFKAGAPGSYYYWAATGGRDAKIDERSPEDTALHGAFIVDAPGAPTNDHIMVIGLWYHFLVPFDFVHGFRELLTVNGKIWPYTTRLTYTAGETARWRVLNPTVAEHPMHLHGAYFRVDAVGDGEHDEIYAPDKQRLVATESMSQGSTMDVSWTPERAGNWIFHCHIAAHFGEHIARTVRDEMAPGEGAAVHEAAAHHDSGSGYGMTGMSGLVVGITVLPKPRQVVNASLKSVEPARRITLTLQQRPASEKAHKCVSIELKDNAGTQTTDPKGEMGPPLILHRGEPTEITVVNRLSGDTAIHWHGIELESYYDGVVGWGGNSKQVTPPIAAGSSFVARITPPRAGTFIYHTHWHDMEQLTGGVYGALIVLEPGQKYDPATDKILLISRQGSSDLNDPILLSGSAAPAPQEWRVGARYRLRLINITPNNGGMQVSLLDGDKPVTWTPIAKDGADLPPLQRITCNAKQRVSVGETYDFEYIPKQPGKLVVETFRPFDKKRVQMPIEVK